MKILVCPSAFKGTFSAIEITEIITTCLREKMGDDIEVLQQPMADGGEGSLDIVSRALFCTKKNTAVCTPLGKNSINATWLMCEKTNRSYIESAKIVGYKTLTQSKLIPRYSNSLGLGLVIFDAISQGAEEVNIMLGDTVIIDAGLGCMYGLGMRFYDKSGYCIKLGDITKNLKSVYYVDTSNMLNSAAVRINLAVDTKTPLCGDNGLVRLYGAQKGVLEKELSEFEFAIDSYAMKIEFLTQKKIRDLPGASAGGGVASSLYGFLGARIVSGFDMLAGFIGLEGLIRDADLVITGEGRIDIQTLYGKVPWSVAQLCRRFNTPVVGITGSVCGITKEQCGLDEIFEIQNYTGNDQYLNMLSTVANVVNFIKNKFEGLRQS